MVTTGRRASSMARDEEKRDHRDKLHTFNVLSSMVITTRLKQLLPLNDLKLSCTTINHSTATATHPATLDVVDVEEDEGEAGSQASPESEQAKAESNERRDGRQVTECLCAQEAREDVCLHGTEDVSEVRRRRRQY